MIKAHDSGVPHKVSKYDNLTIRYPRPGNILKKCKKIARPLKNIPAAYKNAGRFCTPITIPLLNLKDHEDLALTMLGEDCARLWRTIIVPHIHHLVKHTSELPTRESYWYHLFVVAAANKGGAGTGGDGTYIYGDTLAAHRARIAQEAAWLARSYNALPIKQKNLPVLTGKPWRPVIFDRNKAVTFANDFATIKLKFNGTNFSSVTVPVPVKQQQRLQDLVNAGLFRFIRLETHPITGQYLLRVIAQRPPVQPLTQDQRQKRKFYGRIATIDPGVRYFSVMITGKCKGDHLVYQLPVQTYELRQQRVQLHEKYRTQVRYLNPGSRRHVTATTNYHRLLARLDRKIAGATNSLVSLLLNLLATAHVTKVLVGTHNHTEPGLKGKSKRQHTNHALVHPTTNSGRHYNNGIGKPTKGVQTSNGSWARRAVLVSLASWCKNNHVVFVPHWEDGTSASCPNCGASNNHPHGAGTTWSCMGCGWALPARDAVACMNMGGTPTPGAIWQLLHNTQQIAVVPVAPLPKCGMVPGSNSSNLLHKVVSNNDQQASRKPLGKLRTNYARSDSGTNN